MPDQEQITLKVSTQQIEQFCSELCRGTSNISRTHSALIALEGFITRHASSDTYTEQFYDIISTIQQHSERTRQALLKTYAENLIPALLQWDRREITRVYQTVSRSGFEQLLDYALERTTAHQRDNLGLWAEQWCEEAKSRAEIASGHPDALNFNSAGLSLTEYQAICEINRKLRST